MTVLIDADRLPDPMLRRSEITIRRQTFRAENAAVVRLLALYRALYADVAAAVTASGGNRLSDFLAARVARLKADLLALVERAAALTHAGVTVARRWQLSLLTGQTLGRLLPTPADPLTPPMREALALEADDLGLKLRRAISGGLAALTLAAMLKRVQQAIGGVRKQQVYGAYARVSTLARTAVQQAANDAALTVYQNAAPHIDALEWVTADDERVCPACRALDGKRFPLNTTTRPPAHPQCRCALVPIVPLPAGAAPAWEPLMDWARRWGLELYG